MWLFCPSSSPEAGHAHAMAMALGQVWGLEAKGSIPALPGRREGFLAMQSPSLAHAGQAPGPVPCGLQESRPGQPSHCWPVYLIPTTQTALKGVVRNFSIWSALLCSSGHRMLNFLSQEIGINAEKSAAGSDQPAPALQSWSAAVPPMGPVQHSIRDGDTTCLGHFLLPSFWCTPVMSFWSGVLTPVISRYLMWGVHSCGLLQTQPYDESMFYHKPECTQKIFNHWEGQKAIILAWNNCTELEHYFSFLDLLLRALSKQAFKHIWLGWGSSCCHQLTFH